MKKFENCRILKHYLGYFRMFYSLKSIVEEYDFKFKDGLFRSTNKNFARLKKKKVFINLHLYLEKVKKKHQKWEFFRFLKTAFRFIIGFYTL